jgi:opacity protein-like surface antigen
MTTRPWAAAVAAALLFSSSAFAQTPGPKGPALPGPRPLIQLSPANSPRWDVSVQSGRQGVNRTDSAVEWNNWYDSTHVTGSVGYYLTPYLKLEFDAARGAEASITVPQQVFAPGQSWPYTRGREHRVSTVGISGGVHYQFFENAWFHPYVGGGVEAMREHERAQAMPAAAEIRATNGTLLFPAMSALPALEASTTTARPFVGGGFKVYVSRSVFLRSDLRYAISSRRAETVSWRAGVGFDF